ncbi:MAG: cytochrome c biogenesis heme-transporting ATPase CcmA [Pseudomonadota bacterium]
MSPAAPLLEFRNLCFERNDAPLFEGLAGEVRAGDILQVTGANGAGKTTLLRVLTTALTPAAGELYWRQQPLPRARTRYLAELAFLGHAPGFKLGLSPRENLRWLAGLFPRRGGGPEAALAALGLADWADTPCAQLSAGLLRRAALARLPLSGAALWILDEPLTAIDRAGVELVEKLFEEHRRTGGAIIFSSHQPLALPGVKRLALAA